MKGLIFLAVISLIGILLPLCLMVSSLKQDHDNLKFQIEQRDFVNEQNKKIHILDSITIDSLTNYKYNYITNQ